MKRAQRRQRWQSGAGLLAGTRPLCRAPSGLLRYGRVSRTLMRLPASACGSPPRGTGLGRARPSFSSRGAVCNVQCVAGSVPGACGKPPGSPAQAWPGQSPCC